MDWYYYIALAAIILEITFSILIYCNYHYALVKYKKHRSWYRPRTVLIVPCKGLDPDFHKNISSLFHQDYDNYLLWFVVDDQQDPAFNELKKIKDQLSKTSKAKDIQIFVAGHAMPHTCSQKIHNLLYCYQKIADDIEVLAFADSDICINTNWLSHLVYPLRKSKIGAASGYRWFIPETYNPPSLALSVLNAKIVQLLGNSPFNQAWGGSMAIRSDVFRQVALDKIWTKSLSDDLALTRAVKKAGKKIAFVPACLAASYESTTWKKLFEFGRRQFLIARINTLGIWCFGLLCSLFSNLGLWAGTALAIYAAVIGDKNSALYIAVPVMFFITHLGRVILRQRVAAKILEKQHPKMKLACITDILFFWAGSLLLSVIILSSAFGRTIRWRGIRYKLISPTETLVIDS